MLDPFVLTSEEDRWVWLPDPDGNFSVNSSYKLLLEMSSNENGLDGNLVAVLDQLWGSPAPSKVIAFSWQLLYDRIPTRINLEFRRIFIPDSPWECVGCVGKVETSLHLFLHCPCVMWIWGEVLKWIGISCVIPHSIASLFEFFKGSGRNAKTRSGFMMIWHATIWTIWKARNSAIFTDTPFLPWVIIDDIKVVSWKWSLARLKIVPCLYYEWAWDPRDCIRR
jgi:hypothetical protein